MEIELATSKKLSFLAYRASINLLDPRESRVSMGESKHSSPHLDKVASEGHSAWVGAMGDHG